MAKLIIALELDFDGQDAITPKGARDVVDNLITAIGNKMDTVEGVAPQDSDLMTRSVRIKSEMTEEFTYNF